jgi:hypothetical protein
MHLQQWRANGLADYEPSEAASCAMMTVATAPDRSATRMVEDADFFGSVSREISAGE